MAQRATSLGPKPSLFVFCFVFCFWFFVLFFWLFTTKKNLVFPWKRAFFVYFQCFSLSFSLSLFWPPSFCVSLSLSLCFLLFFLSSFLSFFFAVFWFLVFVSFFIFLSSLLFFHERNYIKIFNCQFFLHQYFIFFGFPVFFLSSSFFLSLLFPDFKLCFFVQHQGFWFQNRQLKKQSFLVKRGVATKRFFFINLRFGKCQKLSFFFAHFFGNFGLMFKNTVKTGISAHFQKQKIGKNGHF